MKIGYIRCSSEQQNTARQEVLMQELGVDEVFIDKIIPGTLEYIEPEKE